MRKTILLLCLIYLSGSLFAAKTPTRFDEVLVRDNLTVEENTTLNTLVLSGSVISDMTLSSGTTDKPDLTIKNTNADATGPDIILQKDSASPADNDVLGNILAKGDDASGNVTTYVTIVANSKDTEAGAEDGELEIDVLKGATMIEAIGANDTEVKINDDSKDLDVRIESDANANMFFVDAGYSSIGIKTNIPGSMLDATVSASMQLGGIADESIYMSLKGGANDEAQYSVENDARQYRFGIGSDDLFRIYDDTADVTALSIDDSQNLGIGQVSPNSKVDIDLGTEDLEIVDAGSASASEQDWIEVEVGGNQGYIRVFAAK